jgi:hypothetical protein
MKKTMQFLAGMSCVWVVATCGFAGESVVADVEGMTRPQSMGKADAPAGHVETLSARQSTIVPSLPDLTLRPLLKTASALLPRGAAAPPNLVYVRFSRAMLNRAASQQPFDREAAVSDTILDTPVSGKSRTKGVSELVLVPSRDRADLQVRVVGSTEFDTVGDHKPVTIYSHGVTKFYAHKKVAFDGRTVQVSPAQTAAETDLHTTGIKTDLRGVAARVALRVAERRVADSRQKAALMTSQKTGAQISRELDAAVQAGLQGLTATSQELAGLSVFGALELQQLKLSSTHDYVECVVLGPSDSELLPAPAAAEQLADIELHIHSALIARAVKQPQWEETVQQISATLKSKRPAAATDPLVAAANSAARASNSAGLPTGLQAAVRKLRWTQNGPWLSATWSQGSSSANEQESKDAAPALSGLAVE